MRLVLRNLKESLNINTFLYVSLLYGFFQLLGLAITIIGFILRFGSSLYKPALNFGFTELQKLLNDTNLAAFNPEDIDIGEVVYTCCLFFIVYYYEKTLI